MSLEVLTEKNLKNRRMTPADKASNEGSSQSLILVVDDERSILDYIGLGLKYEGFPFLAASSAQQARHLFESRPVDLVILDRLLPDGDGLELCQRFKQLRSVPVLMLSALGEVEDRVEGLESGADDYLPKPFEFIELIARIKALLRRPKPQGSSEHIEEISSGPVRMLVHQRRVYRGEEEVELTPREFDLLEFLLRRPKRVYSKEQLVQHLWESDFEGYTNTVEVHISALRQKLKDEDRRLIRTVRGVGYAWEG